LSGSGVGGALMGNMGTWKQSEGQRACVQYGATPKSSCPVGASRHAEHAQGHVGKLGSSLTCKPRWRMAGTVPS
jgi:hypothetical protein